MRGGVPVEGGVEEDTLAELVLLRLNLVFGVGRVELEGVAHEGVVVEVGEGDSCELDGPELHVEVVLLLGDGCDVAEVAEQVVDVPDI